MISERETLKCSFREFVYFIKLKLLKQIISLQLLFYMDTKQTDIPNIKYILWYVKYFYKQKIIWNKKPFCFAINSVLFATVFVLFPQKCNQNMSLNKISLKESKYLITQKLIFCMILHVTYFLNFDSHSNIFNCSACKIK